jgi:ATP-dependent DNA ligase
MDPALKPMLCTPADVVPEGPEWVLEGKLDGWRLIMHRTDDAVLTFAGRNGSEYHGKVPYIDAVLLDALPPDTVLDGELIGRKGWGDVQGVMTRGTGGHEPSAAIPALTLVVFDVLRVAGNDARALPWEKRRELLTQIEPNLDLDRVLIAPVGESTAAAHEEMLRLGLEGSVCKRIAARYENRRSAAWVKIKPQTTDEARIIGFKPGKPGTRWDGKVGAFEIEMLDNGGVRTTVKCGTDERHEDATAHPENWLHTVIEIKHHGIQSSGVPRHPQFFRRRDDRTEPVAPARTAPKMTAPRRPAGGGSGRNYGAMGAAKLERCIRELEAGSGDAYERCIAKGADPQADLAIARQALGA